jgi:hypothetical protein
MPSCGRPGRSKSPHPPLVQPDPVPGMVVSAQPCSYPKEIATSCRAASDSPEAASDHRSLSFMSTEEHSPAFEQITHEPQGSCVVVHRLDQQSRLSICCRRLATGTCAGPGSRLPFIPSASVSRSGPPQRMSFTNCAAPDCTAASSSLRR